ncbi:BTAD domain-containing putative transcriptional regulator [Lentzea sp. NPDC005914]|uniref:AfsR/SARP family transcriptional regulator n=1 Tax=Lentzea sp. NPDC005914 TaxID=3154572 RepID=UPI0033FCDFE8
MTAEFRVLGTLEVSVRGRVVPLPAGHTRVALAGLLLRANELVTTDRMVRWLWNGDPPGPDRAVKTVQMVIARLRKALGEANVVTTVSGGYTAVISPHQLDLARFRDLVATGAASEALSLWRGPVLTDVHSESLRREEIDPLAEERLTALELRLADDLERGRHAEVIPELRALTRQHPLREPFWAHLILALHRCGQQAEALAAYRAVTRLFAEELGSTPGRELRGLHERILTGATISVPRQLPAVNPHFVGREAELTALGSAAVSVIHGTAGVGKTALAVKWCRGAADRFPGGQLYVNLRGFDPSAEPVRPSDVLRGFLDALKVPADEIPSTVEERSALFQRLLAGRKVLVLLDNARDADQVRPLLPDSPERVAVVTSRDPLSGLENARAVDLTTLTRDESEAVLASHLGLARLQADPGAARDLVERCAGLPLALAVVAARASATTFPLRELADDLIGAGLDMLGDDDSSTDVRAVFSWSYQQLSPAAARLFRLLGVRGGGVIGVHAALALAGGEVRPLLAELVRTQLVSSPAPDRFGCHDLLAAYSAELSHLDPGREAALERLLDYYLHCADIADGLLPVMRTPVDISPRHRPTETPPLTTADEATAWFGTELTNVISAIESAAAHNRPTHAWQLTYTLSRYLWLRSDFSALLRVCHLALPCTEGTTEPRLAMLMNIGVAHERLHEFEESATWLRKALDLSGHVSELARARVLGTLAAVLEHLRHFDDAEAHHLEAAATARKAGATWVEAIARQSLAIFYRRMRRWDEAEQQLRRALAMYDQVGEQVGAVSCRQAMAEVQLGQGQFEAARTAARTTLALSREIGSRYHEAGSLALIGDAAHELGAEDAADHWELALTIYDELGVPEADEVRAKLQAVRNV